MSGRRVLKIQEVINLVESKQSKIFTLDGQIITQDNFGKVKDKYLFECPQCGQLYTRTYDCFKTCQLCPNCGKVARGLKGRTTHKEYLEKLEYLGNELIPLEEYITDRMAILHLCPKCQKPFYAKPRDVLNRNQKGCIDCSGKKLLTTEDFKNYIAKETNGQYELLSEYINANMKVQIKHLACNTIYEVTPHNFKSLNRRCPNCFKNYKKDTEVFKKELSLEVREEYTVLGEYVDYHTKILVRHNVCGNKYEVKPANIMSGKRCPLCNQSKGERRINKYLLEHDIVSVPQKEYDGLIGLGGGLLSYDVYIPQLNLLIEYQGEMHEKYVKGVHKSIEDFKKQVEHDRRKKEYADKNNIELLEIWYWDYNNIEKILEERLIP